MARRPKRPKTKKSPKKQRAKNPAAVALGRLGGSKGGPARATALSPEKRSQIAKAAAKARWSRRPKTASDDETGPT